MIPELANPYQTPHEAQKFLMASGLTFDQAVQITESREKFEFFLGVLYHMAQKP